MKTIKLSIVKKSTQNKDGLCAFLLCAYHNNKRRYFTLTSAATKDWNAKKLRVNSTDSDFLSKNQIIESSWLHANKIVHNHDVSRKTLTLEDFAAYFETDYNNESFIDFGKQYIADNHARLSADSRHTYNTLLTKLQCFKADIVFSDITPAFIDRYMNYILN